MLKFVRSEQQVAYFLMPRGRNPGRLGAALVVLVLSLFGLACAEPTATEVDDDMSRLARSYIDEAFDLLETYYVRRDSVDWVAQRAAAMAAAEGAVYRADTYAAIRGVLRTFNDSNTRLSSPSTDSNPFGVAARSLAPKVIAGRIAFLPVTAATVSGVAADAWASALQAQIRQLDGAGVCAWVVDIRDNTGGNMWAMAAGLGPLLGGRRFGAFVDPVGDMRVDWIHDSGNVYSGSQRAAGVVTPYSLEGTPPVAVMTGFSTVKSGEAIAVAFRGRPETRHFGAATRGMANSARRFDLSDGARLYITDAVFADRTGGLYGREFLPDEVISGPDTGNLATDPALARAAEWLLARPACNQ